MSVYVTLRQQYAHSNKKEFTNAGTTLVDCSASEAAALVMHDIKGSP